MDEIFKPAVKQVNGCEELDDALLYQSLEKRIGNIPDFVNDCCQQWGVFADSGNVSGIKIEGDKAAGYEARIATAPNPKDLENGPPPENYLPQYYPYHFRRVDGSWLFADAPLHQ